MSSTRSITRASARSASGGQPDPTATRFHAVFAREPSARELAAYRAAHQALVLGLPARARRRAARLLTRL